MQDASPKVDCLSDLSYIPMRFQSQHLPAYNTYVSHVFDPSLKTSAAVANIIGNPGDLFVLHSSPIPTEPNCRFTVFVKGRNPRPLAGKEVAVSQWRMIVDNTFCPVVCPTDPTLTLAGISCGYNQFLHWCPELHQEENFTLGACYLLCDRQNAEGHLHSGYVSLSSIHLSQFIFWSRQVITPLKIRRTYNGIPDRIGPSASAEVIDLTQPQVIDLTQPPEVIDLTDFK